MSRLLNVNLYSAFNKYLSCCWRSRSNKILTFRTDSLHN